MKEVERVLVELVRLVGDSDEHFYLSVTARRIRIIAFAIPSEAHLEDSHRDIMRYIATEATRGVL